MTKYHAPNADHIPDVLIRKRELYRLIERMAGMTVAQVRPDCMGNEFVLADPKPNEIYAHVLEALAAQPAAPGSEKIRELIARLAADADKALDEHKMKPDFRAGIYYVIHELEALLNEEKRT